MHTDNLPRLDYDVCDRIKHDYCACTFRVVMTGQLIHALFVSPKPQKLIADVVKYLGGRFYEKMPWEE